MGDKSSIEVDQTPIDSQDEVVVEEVERASTADDKVTIMR